MTQPDDRELEQYLEGGSKLSRRYRDAGGETSPPDLDEAILARARAEAKRKPDLNRLLAPVALAATVVIGVNLAWNVMQFAPAPGAAPAEKSRDDRFVPEPPPAEPLARAEAPAAAPAPQPERKKARAAASPPATAPQEAEADAALAAQEQSRERQAKSEERFVAQESAGASAPAAALAPSALADSAPVSKAAPLSETEKIDRLIDYVRTLPGAVFIRNGTEYGPAEAAKHLQLKREKAGSRVKTADDFIRLCASHSSMSGDAYLIRLADGRTRTAEDVLRDKLATLR